MMSDGIPRCSRCGEALSEDAFALSIQRELPNSVPQDLRFCPRCIRSFERWYGKRRKLSSSLALDERPANSASVLAESISEKRSRRSRRRKAEKSHSPGFRGYVPDHPAVRLRLLLDVDDPQVDSEARRINSSRFDLGSGLNIRQLRPIGCWLSGRALELSARPFKSGEDSDRSRSSADKPVIAAFMVEDDAKADHYIKKLQKKFPGIRVIDRFAGPAPETITVRVGVPLR